MQSLNSSFERELMSPPKVILGRWVSHDRSGYFQCPKLTNRQNALHFASSKNNISIVRTLLANKGSARVKDKRGQLPLHRAAAVGSVPIMKMLLEEGKSPVNATDGDGYTALHQAIAEGHGPAAILLLKSGADPLKRDSNDKLAIELCPDDKVCLFSKS